MNSPATITPPGFQARKDQMRSMRGRNRPKRPAGLFSCAFPWLAMKLIGRSW